jgi:hypothetical protein
VDAFANPGPFKLPTGFRHAVEKSDCRGGDHILPVLGINGECKEGFARQVGRTRFRNPIRAAIVAAEDSNPAVGWKGAGHARAKILQRVAFPGPYIEAVGIRRV